MLRHQRSMRATSRRSWMLDENSGAQKRLIGVRRRMDLLEF